MAAPAVKPRWRRWILALGALPIGAALLFVLVCQRAVSSQRARGLTFLADVFVARPDGTVEQVTPGDGVYHFASLHPDGTRLVYEGGASGVVRLWELDLATGDREPLTPEDSAALHPNYSWDGSRIAFVSDRDSPGEPLGVEELPIKGMYGDHVFHVYVMDLRTRETLRLSDGPVADFRPSFSPDGETVVFSSRRGDPPNGPCRLWTVKSDGSEPPSPIAFEGSAYNASWAADGESIFFHSVYKGREIACRWRPGEPLPEPMPNDRFERTHGEFADPRGELLLVHAVHEGEWGMWELPLDGGPARPFQLPGLERGMHPSRALDGTTSFDVERWVGLRSELRWRLRRFLD